MQAEKIIKTGQEQAVASWVNYLNQVRLDRLFEALKQQDQNLKNAMESLSNTLSKINSEIIERNRGGTKGMHGFIAEVAECGIGNARKQIHGLKPDYQWINDNGPVDIKRGMQDIQQKFVQSGGHLSLRAITEHMKTYPDYLRHGGIYQIPQDHYEKIQYYLSITEEEANKMPTSTSEFSLKQWREVHEFFNSDTITVKDIEPSTITYSDAQKDAIPDTINRERKHISKEDQKRRDDAYQESKPTLAEGAKVTAVSAAIEGATAFGSAVVKKRKSGKKFSDFELCDWQEIAAETGKGSLKGGVRGLSMYALTNYTATPAAVASATVTASFGIAQQVHLFRTGTIDEESLIENSEILCVDAAVSALSSFAGQVLIPVPVLGAVIGNTVGMMIYQAGKDKLTEKEQTVINGYLKEIEELNSKLDKEYQEAVTVLRNNFAIYIELVETAFSPDLQTALDGSVTLAEKMGVPAEELLSNKAQIASYFLD